MIAKPIDSIFSALCMDLQRRDAAKDITIAALQQEIQDLEDAIRILKDLPKGNDLAWQTIRKRSSAVVNGVMRRP